VAQQAGYIRKKIPIHGLAISPMSMFENHQNSLLGSANVFGEKPVVSSKPGMKVDQSQQEMSDEIEAIRLPIRGDTSVTNSFPQPSIAFQPRTKNPG